MNFIKQYYFKTFAVCAAAFSMFMIAFQFQQLIEVFQLADPTGLFGFMIQVGNFLSNLCVIIIAALVITKKGTVQRKVAVSVFGLKLLEVLSLLPCTVGFGDAFCGLWWVILSKFTGPAVIIITLLFFFKSGKKPLFLAGVGIVASVAVSSFALFIVLTPKNPESCFSLEPVTSRAACLEKFALRENDVAICRKIEFRSTRFSCLYKVAKNLETPAVCEEIKDAPETEIAVYDSPSIQTKDLCYYLLGFKMHNQEICQKITDDKMRKTCLNGAGTPGQKRKLF